MEKNNAKLNRNVIRWLVAAAALGGVQIASAGYAQLANPAGFGGSAGSYTYAAAANDKVFGRVVQSSGSLAANVGGQSVKMGAAYRLAANAPRIAALVVMQHPVIRIGVAAVGIASWLLAAKLVWDEANGVWREQYDSNNGTGLLYRVDFPNSQWQTSKEAACSAYVGYLSGVAGGGWYVDGSSGGAICPAVKGVYPSQDKAWAGYSTKQAEIVNDCPAGWLQTPAGCLSPALDQPTFVDKLASKPMPESVPLELPYPSPLPIEQPSPWINPTPGDNPQSQPYRAPTGQPSPIPNTNPQQYKQPYVDIIPAPLPDNPWRVDIKPGEVTSTDPNPVTNPKPDDSSNPSDEKDKSLCEKHPDILACSKPELDIPTGEIPKTTKTINYQVEDVFGGGSCPADIYTNINNQSVRVYEWSATCNVITTYLRPIILLLGAMGALFILIPGRDS